MLQTNIFFFITAVSVLLLTIFIVVALYYIIRILHNMEKISKRAEEETEHVAQGVHELHSSIRSGGKIFLLIANIIRILSGGRRGKK